MLLSNNVFKNGLSFVMFQVTVAFLTCLQVLLQGMVIHFKFEKF